MKAKNNYHIIDIPDCCFICSNSLIDFEDNNIIIYCLNFQAGNTLNNKEIVEVFGLCHKFKKIRQAGGGIDGL